MSDSERLTSTQQERPLRIVLHVVPGNLDIVAPMVREIGRLTELHVLLEVPPSGWSMNALGLPYPAVSDGVIDGRPFLAEHLPATLLDDFAAASSVRLVVYPPGLGLGAARTLHRCARIVRSLEPDLIHFESESPRAAALWALLRMPFVLGMHEPRVPAKSGYAHLAAIKQLAPRFARRVIVHSEAARRQLLTQVPDCAAKTDVVPLAAIDTYTAYLDSARASASERRTVLFLGRLTPRKGVDRFLAVAGSTARVVTDVDFIVAGMPVRGVQPPQSCELPNGCRLTVHAKRLSPSDLAAVMHGADVVVTPYDDARQSGIILTAFAFSKPVIATAVGGLKEQVIHDQTGLLVPVDDAEALHDAVVRVLADPEWRKRVSAAISVSATGGQLSWERVARETTDIYKRAVPERRPSPPTALGTSVVLVGIGYEPHRMFSDKNHMRAVAHAASALPGVNVWIVSIGEHSGVAEDCFEGDAVPVRVLTLVRPGHRLRRAKIEGHYTHARHRPVREYAERSLVCLALIPVLRQLRSRHGVQVVHYFDNLGPLAGPAARAAGMASIVTMLGRSTGGDSTMRRLLWRSSFMTVDAVVASTSELAHELRSAGAPVRAVIPIHAGADPGLPVLERRLVVWTGRLQRMGARELSFAAPAMASCMALHPEMQCEVWPKPEFADEYEPISRAAGVPVQVPGIDFHRRLRDVRILVSPVSDPRTIVGPPLTWLEVLASGGVVVTTPCRGVDPSDLDSGRIVMANSLSVDDIVAAIEAAWECQRPDPDGSIGKRDDIAGANVAIWRDLA